MVAPDDRMTLVEHLDELRNRIFVSLLALVIGVVIAAIFDDAVFSLLLRPLPPEVPTITTFSPAEPFMISLKVWVYMGAIMASPLIIYEFWAYVGPAFTPGEKRYFMPVVVVCSVLFLAGVAFGYLVVLPRGLNILLNFNSEYFNVQTRANDYFSFVATFLLAFGAVFEMPVVIVLAVKVGIVDTAFLKKNRRYAILVNAVVAAVLTPSPDAFSMLAMFVPLLALYEVSILVAGLVEPKEKIWDQFSDDDESPPGDDDHDLSKAPA